MQSICLEMVKCTFYLEYTINVNCNAKYGNGQMYVLCRKRPALPSILGDLGPYGL